MWVVALLYQLAGRRRLASGRLAQSLAGLISVAAAAVASPLLAQVARLPGQDYGRVVLPLRESIGGALGFVRQTGNVFEPLGQLRPDDRLSRLTRGVGRLDVLVLGSVGEYLETCTAALVRSDLVLTNYHCVPGLSGRVIKVSLVLDYLQTDGNGARRVELEAVPVEADPRLDYALLRVRGDGLTDIGPIRLSDREIKAQDRFRIVHHPAGQPKMMTQFRCGAVAPDAKEGLIRHTCDTLPGSSGAIVFDHDDMTAVGLHHSGGLNPNDSNSFNTATSMRALLIHSAILRGIASGVAKRPDVSDSHVAPSPADAATAINDFLRR